MKSFFTIVFSLLAVLVVSAQNDKEANFDLFDNAGEQIDPDKSIDLSKIKYLVVSVSDENIELIDSEITLVSGGLGTATYEGDKIINIKEGLQEKYKNGDKLVIEIRYKGKNDISAKSNTHFITFTLKKL